MARNGMEKFLKTVMVLLILIGCSVQADRCGFSLCYLDWPYYQVTDKSTTASEPYGGPSKDSTQHHLFHKDPERNNQIQDEVARKNQEINKLRTTIRSALHQLNKVDFREEIPYVSDTYIDREIRHKIVRIDKEIVMLKKVLKKLNKVPPTTDVSKPGDGTENPQKRHAPDNERTAALNPKRSKLDNRANNGPESSAKAYAVYG